MEYDPPKFGPPYRVLLLAAASHGWYQADDQAERERILAALSGWWSEWEERGARLIGSFDDDYFVVGQPAALPYSIYCLYEVDDVGLIATQIQRAREEIDGIRLDSCFRMDARVGRSLFFLSK